ncbi:hypothetical protein ALI144C_35560 [Actinosynnema sp. ALI-1.44]|nr:hypothetical protein ALI144C_35560 [Actinosynnema sp. ALI-1.44]
MTATLVGLTLVATGCDDDPTRTAVQGSEVGMPTSTPPSTAVEAGTFAYTTPGRVTLARGRQTLASVSTGDPVRFAEWTADGSRFVAASATRLISIDTATGAKAEVGCQCYEIAVAAGKVFVLDEYGGQDLAVHDVVTLEPAGRMKPSPGTERGLVAVTGAGERVVTFQINGDGARWTADVVVVDQTGGTPHKFGETTIASDLAYTPTGWDGKPKVAYVVIGTSGSSTGQSSVVWFDPATPGVQAETRNQELRALPPGVSEKDWNNTVGNLWWAADGTVRVDASTWTCSGDQPLAGPRCDKPAPQGQWKFDGARWQRTEEHGLTSRRELGGDLSLVRRRPSATSEETALLLDEKGALAPVADKVGRVWTPPSSRAKAPRITLPEVKNVVATTDPAHPYRVTLKWDPVARAVDYQVLTAPGCDLLPPSVAEYKLQKKDLGTATTWTHDQVTSGCMNYIVVAAGLGGESPRQWPGTRAWPYETNTTFAKARSRYFEAAPDPGDRISTITLSPSADHGIVVVRGFIRNKDEFTEMIGDHRGFGTDPYASAKVGIAWDTATGEIGVYVHRSCVAGANVPKPWVAGCKDALPIQFISGAEMIRDDIETPVNYISAVKRPDGSIRVGVSAVNSWGSFLGRINARVILTPSGDSYTANFFGDKFPAWEIYRYPRTAVIGSVRPVAYTIATRDQTSIDDLKGYPTMCFGHGTEQREGKEHPMSCM